MTVSKDEMRLRTALLKRLREDRVSSIDSTRREICQAMRQGAATVPEIAASSGLPSHQVLWHLTAMKKYDLVIEVGQCGEYYQYELAKEAEA